jgi:CPA2 family monovalent cation:H+ antiporter-2
MNALVAAAILSIMINPIVYRWGVPMEAFLKRRPSLWRLLNRRSGMVSGMIPGEAAELPMHRAIVVGHGPIGRLVARILRDGGIEPVIVELNVETFRSLQAAGERAVYGDATQREVLEEAGAATAVSIILSASGSSVNTEAIRIARELNPRIQVVARADFLRDTEQLKRAGADEVFSGEGEVAQAIAASTLRQLGATPEQMDEARERIRLTLLETHS